jgi:hypothetical protein
MVVYKKKNFTKALGLVLRYHERYKSYQFIIYSRDGKYSVYASGFYEDLDTCTHFAVRTIESMSIRISAGLPPTVDYRKPKNHLQCYR